MCSKLLLKEALLVSNSSYPRCATTLQVYLLAHVEDDIGEAVVRGALEHAGLVGPAAGQLPPHRQAGAAAELGCGWAVAAGPFGWGHEKCSGLLSTKAEALGGSEKWGPPNRGRVTERERSGCQRY